MPPSSYHNIALVLKSEWVRFEEVQQAAAVIQQQIQSPEFLQWPGTKPGQVTAFTKDSKIPDDAAPVYIQDKIERKGLSGFHVTTTNQMPYAHVQSDGNWSITASHEILELLVDPTGNKTLPAPSLEDPNVNVDYLVEVCDPVNNPVNAISVGLIGVSDFYLPSYFDPVAVSGKQYSANKRLTAPRQILEGGYVVFRDANGQWFEADQQVDGAPPEISAISLPDFNGSLREKVDFLTRARMRRKRIKASPKPQRTPRVKKISAARLKEYREHQRAFEIMIRKYKAKRKK